jgi:hypothetical protein
MKGIGHLKEIEMIVKGKNITKGVRREFQERAVFLLDLFPEFANPGIPAVFFQLVLLVHECAASG